jgi:hypothetical protein
VAKRALGDGLLMWLYGRNIGGTVRSAGFAWRIGRVDLRAGGARRIFGGAIIPGPRPYPLALSGRPVATTIINQIKSRIVN